MFRIMLSVLCLFAVAGFVTAEEKGEKGTSVAGKFDSYKDGKLTILVDAKPQTFEVKDDVKTLTFSSSAEKPIEAAAKDAFKEVKAGTEIRVILDADKKVAAISIGTPAKKGDK
jgi:hypothetical protein